MGFVICHSFLNFQIANAKPYAFPVPFIASKHTEIVFKDLPGAGTIKVMTVGGEQVIQLDVANGELVKHWDVTNSAGRRIAAGVYFFSIDAGDQHTVGKLVVIR